MLFKINNNPPQIQIFAKYIYHLIVFYILKLKRSDDDNNDNKIKFGKINAYPN